MRRPQPEGVAPFDGPALPITRDERVDRPSVDELLDRGAKRRICVVIAAAGWGKTTAVATWSRSRPAMWLRYEDYEGDARRLLRCLCEALEAHLPVFAGQPDSAAAICDQLRSVLSEDLILVLDDVHGLQPDGSAARVVESLCQRAPDHLHLILICRYELPFSLQRLRGRGLVTEIHAPDLAFDVVDIETFLRKTVGNDPPGLARQIWEHTGGWATAVHSVVEMLRAVQTDQRLAVVERLSHPGERFSDYLAEEVIGAAPEWVQQLLRGLAISGEVRSTAESLYGVDDPTPVLAELSRQGLVRRNAGEGASWSLVRPLRDYFEHGPALSAAERAALHVTAAGECIKRGAPAEALHHLLAAGDHAACVSLLVDHGDAMVQHGEPGAVLEATRLPPEHLNDPQIQRVFGQAQQVRGEWAQAQAHFQRAGHNQDELEPGLAWRIGGIAFARGEFAEVQAVTRRARLDGSDTLDKTRLLALIATVHRMTGDLEGLRKMALQTRAAARQCGHPRAWADAHHVFVMLAAAEGDWRQADAHCSDAVRNAEASEDLLQLVWITMWRAFHQLEAGAPQQALADAQHALKLCEQCENPPFLVAHALTTRTRACLRLGALAEASDFATAVDIFQRLGSRFLAWPLCGLGDLHRTRGHLTRARAAYEEALALAEPYHDVFGLSSALTGLARIEVADDPQRARELAARAVNLNEGLRTVPALLARGWVELMSGDQRSATADSHRAITAARQRRDNLGLAEAITLSVLASSDPTAGAAPLREAIEIWQETGCCLEEAATRIVAAHIDAPIPDLGAHHADQILQDHGVDISARQVAGPLGVLVRSAPAWSIKTLGVFRVIRDGLPIPYVAWKSKKARDLLRILVARRRPTPREQLMELLWPEVEPAVAGNRLSVLLSAVRDVLQPHPEGEPPLITTDGAVSLNLSQVKIDVEEFLSRATAALNADRADDPTATELLTAALDTYTGAFFEDDPDQEWASWLAEEVRATHIAVLRALAARMRRAGDTDAAVRYTLRLLEQDNFDEPAHITLIGALTDASRLGEARRHWETYRRCMNEVERPPLTLAQIAEGKNLSRR
jgi:ATP/maltotriose-dependent transcriptional regulator MalT/DNA-binding SARP family transcriptional activator